MVKRVTLGRIGAPYGVRGWLWIHSSTWPAENILSYERWQVQRRGEWQELQVLQARPQGKALIALLQDLQGRVIADRDAAAQWSRAEIAVWRSELPALQENEVYWADLIGLQVITTQGQSLGEVHQMIETGANDVLVVRGERERLIPFVRDIYVKDIDLQRSVIRVDWDPEF